MVAAATSGVPGVTDEERRATIAEIEAREQITIGRPTKLKDDTDHVAWYFGQRRTAGRAFYARYVAFLHQNEGWGSGMLAGLDESTDAVMESIEDPRRPGSWDRRGLVLGHVQSGKTANYAGLLCKAADAGYRLLIVLAGMHNVLRLQTQLRLDRDFLGYKSTSLGTGEGLSWVGVGLIDRRPKADFLTTRDTRGDFDKARAERQGIAPESRPLLLVIKKNARILANLNAWVGDFLVGRGDTHEIPLLVIDDEADQASVDTGEQDFINGVPDPDYEPKRVNAEIRKLLKAFDKSAYVAYTATPFANILVHDRRETDVHGADIFPRSFIVNLPRPSSYIGPVEVFGIDRAEGTPLTGGVLDAFREVDQTREGWIPQDHDRTLVPVFDGAERIPPSLEEAILAFVLVCAARRARGQVNKHNTMLVHVSRFKDVHREVRGQADQWFTDLRREVRYSTGPALQRLATLWQDDFVPSAIESEANGFDARVPLPAWHQVEAELVEVVDRIKVVVVNSDSLEPLDYDANAETGLNVIAVGGDKLSRGLTLEGLSVSYFLRASRMYDSLMQMGRWFGYRPGYVDLCRLYTTDDLRLHYRHVATASEELREQLDHMQAMGETPERYGLKIQSHPLLLVTARNKMRYTNEYEVSFAGQGKIQTVFDRDEAVIRTNARVTAEFLGHQGKPNESGRTMTLANGSVVSWPGRHLWNNVPGSQVSAWLRSLRFAPESYEVSGVRMAEYIDAQVANGELTNWTVALVDSGKGGKRTLGDREVNTTQRRVLDRVGRTIRSDRYVVGTILDPWDESIDLDPLQFAAALDLTNRARAEKGLDPEDRPGGLAIRLMRGMGQPDRGISGDPRRGLVIIYPLDPSMPSIDVNVPIIGLVVSFPESGNARAAVRYRFNTVLDRLELV
ncbi:MAG: Z1 domain-containing protein [Thiobacillaceae bacterium]